MATDTTEAPNKQGSSIDLLHGCKAIAQYLFESDDIKHQRKVYHLAEKTNLPTFKLGGVLCARRSTIEKFIETQENR